MNFNRPIPWDFRVSPFIALSDSHFPVVSSEIGPDVQELLLAQMLRENPMKRSSTAEATKKKGELLSFFFPNGLGYPHSWTAIPMEDPKRKRIIGIFLVDSELRTRKSPSEVGTPSHHPFRTMGFSMK